jgi:hypothetical protein
MDQATTSSASFDPAFQKVTLLEQVKIQAQVLVPVIRAFRKELGEERANEIVSTALREWSRSLFEAIGNAMPGSPKEKFMATMAASGTRIGKDVDFQMLKQDQQGWEFNITGCRYADFFRQLGEPELGAMLLCEVDFDLVKLAGPEVELNRTQTIMKGASYCDFRYKMKTGQS